MREALGRGRSPPEMELLYPPLDMRGDDSRGATPRRATAAGAPPQPCGTFRRPSRTIRVEPIRRPAKERAVPVRERSPERPPERASDPQRRARTKERRP